jgi:hypothetical protein
MFPNSVILNEASAGRTFPAAVGRAESKDLDCIFGTPGIKVTLPSMQGGEAAIGDESLSAFDHPGESHQVLRLRECFAFAPLRMTEF